MTHKEIVDFGEKWLRKKKSHNIVVPNCTTIAKELVTMNSETPDLIGWNYACSVVIEVKTSLADFKRDAKKIYRNWSSGMGQLRYFLVPAGLITIEDVKSTYNSYGLLYIDDNGKIRIAKEAKFKDNADVISERMVLLSIIRRQRNELKSLINEKDLTTK